MCTIIGKLVNSYFKNFKNAIINNSLTALQRHVNNMMYIKKLKVLYKYTTSKK